MEPGRDSRSPLRSQGLGALARRRQRRAHFAEAKNVLPGVTIGRHRLPVIACKRAIVVPDIADAPIDIREGCPLFPSVGNTADSRQGAVFYSYVGAAAAIGSLWRRFGMGGLHEHRAGDQERRKPTEKDFHGRSFRDV